MMCDKQVTLLSHSVGFVVAILMLQCAAAAHADFVRLMIDSEPGDFIGQGQELTLEYDNDLGSRLQTFSSNSSIRWVLDDAVGTTFNTFAGVEFRTDTVDLPLQTGTFLGARRAPFADPGEPGMSVTFQNRGSNQLFGEFTINQIDFLSDSGSSIVGRIDVSFEQHSESPSRPALFGNIFYQHSDFVPIPEPVTAALLTTLAGAAAMLRRRNRHAPLAPRRSPGAA